MKIIKILSLALLLLTSVEANLVGLFREGLRLHRDVNDGAALVRGLAHAIDNRENIAARARYEVAATAYNVTHAVASMTGALRRAFGNGEPSLIDKFKIQAGWKKAPPQGFFEHLDEWARDY